MLSPHSRASSAASRPTASGCEAQLVISVRSEIGTRSARSTVDAAVYGYASSASFNAPLSDDCSAAMCASVSRERP